MAHRLRAAMRDGSLAPMSDAGGVVEVDETFIGTDRTIKPKGEKKDRGQHCKHKVHSLMDRDTGQKPAFIASTRAISKSEHSTPTSSLRNAPS